MDIFKLILMHECFESVKLLGEEMLNKMNSSKAPFSQLLKLNEVS